jgi:branched-chain amino acid transport system ATP-binding protein
MIKDINRKGISILLIEQNATMALRVANRAYVLENGIVKLSGKTEQLLNHNDVKKAYLGELLNETVSEETLESFENSKL